MRPWEIRTRRKQEGFRRVLTKVGNRDADTAKTATVPVLYSDSYGSTAVVFRFGTWPT